MIEVQAPSGHTHRVLNALEEDYYNQTAQKYLGDYKFENVSDLQELDKILVGETLCHRWATWLSTESDYDGNRIDLTEIRKSRAEQQKEILDIKKNLGMDKVTRDKDKGQQTATYLEDLRHRAEEFGIMRNKQAVAAITMWQELVSIVQFHKNLRDDERKEEHVTEKEIINWIESKIPEFEEIDREFQLGSQRYWVQQM